MNDQDQGTQQSAPDQSLRDRVKAKLADPQIVQDLKTFLQGGSQTESTTPLTDANTLANGFPGHTPARPAPVQPSVRAHQGDPVTDWLEQAKADVQYGGNRTFVGKVLHPGATKLNPAGSGTSPVGDSTAAQFMAGPVLGPLTGLHGLSIAQQHPARGFNEVVQGVGQTVGPFAAANPAAIPAFLGFNALQKGAGTAAGAFGADPDTQEAIGNLAGLSLAAPKLYAETRNFTRTGPAQPGSPEFLQANPPAAPGPMETPQAPVGQGNTQLLNLLNTYNMSKGYGTIQPENLPVDPRAHAIGEAYANLQHNPSDPAVQASYQALINDVRDQHQFLTRNGYTFEPWAGQGEPYANSDAMRADLLNNKRLNYLPTGDEMTADHPLAGIDPTTGLRYNDMFRAVHDAVAHGVQSNQFGPMGEERAWNIHRQTLSPEAQAALMTETKGQNSFVNAGEHLRSPETGAIPGKGEPGYIAPPDRPFAEQKAAILPEQFLQREDVQSHTPQKFAEQQQPQQPQILPPRPGEANGMRISALMKELHDAIDDGDQRTAAEIQQAIARERAMRDGQPPRQATSLVDPADRDQAAAKLSDAITKLPGNFAVENPTPGNLAWYTNLILQHHIDGEAQPFSPDVVDSVLRQIDPAQIEKETRERWSNREADGIQNAGIYNDDEKMGNVARKVASYVDQDKYSKLGYDSVMPYEEARQPAPKTIDAPQTVGSTAGAKNDTQLFQQARQQLGDKASISEVAQLAQQLKEQKALPAQQGQDVPVIHYSKEAGLNTVEPRSEGNQGWFFHDHPFFENGDGNKYYGTVKNAYDLQKDPLKLGSAAAARKAGYSGVIHGDGTVTAFSDVPVRSTREATPQSEPAAASPAGKPTPFSDKLVEKYGTTQDPMQAGFILPDGRMVPLRGEHPEMLSAVGYNAGEGANGGKIEADKAAFLKDENVVRARSRMTRGGQEMVYSVPDNVTPEQMKMMRAGVGQMGRYGNLVIEKADGKAALKKEFSLTRDVDDMVQKLGAQPGEQAPAQGQAAQPTPKFGENNKVFTREKADEALKFIKGQAGKLNSGIDVVDGVKHAVNLAGYIFEGGAREFGEFSKKILSVAGEGGKWLKPRLQDLYDTVKGQMTSKQEWKPPAGLEQGIPRDEAVDTNMPLSKLHLSTNAMDRATMDNSMGRGSRTKGPIEVVYDPDHKQFLVADGMHRVKEAIDRGDATIPAKLWSGYSDSAPVREGDRMMVQPNPEPKSFADADLNEKRTTNIGENRVNASIKREVNQNGAGEHRNQRTVLKGYEKTNDDGEVTKYHDLAIGPVTTQDIKDRIESTLSPQELNESRDWYRNLRPEFVKHFGEENADKMLHAWLVSQINTSPAGGMQNLMRVTDQIQGHQGFSNADMMNEGAMRSVLEGEIPESGLGQKLHDFIDSALGKKLRTNMGNHPLGMSPAAIDRWAALDLGYVGGKQLNQVKEIYGAHPEGANDAALKKLKKDFSNAPGEPLYENSVKRYNDLAKQLNAEGWKGGNWTPAELQAVGWNAIQKAMGLEPEGPKSLFEKNTATVNASLEFSPNATYHKDFPSPNTLGPEKAQKVTSTFFQKITPQIEKRANVKIVQRLDAPSGYQGTMEPGSHMQVFGSPEAVDRAINLLGQAAQQDSVIAHRELKSGNTRGVLITELGSGRHLNKPDVLKSYWERLKQIDPEIAEGFSPTEVNGKPALKLLNLGAKTWTPAQIDKFVKEVDRVGKDMDIFTESHRINAEVKAASNDWRRYPDGRQYRQRGGTGKPSGVQADSGLHGDFQEQARKALEESYQQHAADELRQHRERDDQPGRAGTERRAAPQKTTAQSPGRNPGSGVIKGLGVPKIDKGTAFDFGHGAK